MWPVWCLAVFALVYVLGGPNGLRGSLLVAACS
jgi:hypothetical protein